MFIMTIGAFEPIFTVDFLVFNLFVNHLENEIKGTNNIDTHSPAHLGKKFIITVLLLLIINK